VSFSSPEPDPFYHFVVILCTLVLQGLSLPLLVRWLKLEVQKMRKSSS